MSTRFDAAADLLTIDTNLPNSDPVTATFWMLLDVDRNATGNIWQITNSDGTAFESVFLDSNGTTLEIRTSTGATDGTNLSTGVWYHIGYTRSGATHNLYLNGVLDITRSHSTSITPAAVLMGSNSAVFMNGRVAGVKMWNAALTVAEINLERYTLLPKRYTDLYAFWPMRAGQRTIDLSGNGRNWTEGGTLADNDPPPVGWGGHPLYVPFVPGAVTEDADLSLNRVLAQLNSGLVSASSSVSLSRVIGVTDSGIANTLSSISVNRIESITDSAFNTTQQSNSLNRVEGITGSGLASALALLNANRVDSISQSGLAESSSDTTLGKEVDITTDRYGVFGVSNSLSKILTISNSTLITYYTNLLLNRIETVNNSGQANTSSSSSLNRILAISTSAYGIFPVSLALAKIITETSSGNAQALGSSSLNRILTITNNGLVEAESSVELDLVKTIIIDRLIYKYGNVNLNTIRTISSSGLVDSLANILLNTVRLIESAEDGTLVVNVDVSLNKVLLASFLNNVQAIGVISLLKSVNINVVGLANSFSNNLLNINKNVIIDRSVLKSADLTLTLDLSNTFNRQINLLEDISLSKNLVTTLIGQASASASIEIIIHKIVILDSHTILVEVGLPAIAYAGDRVVVSTVLKDELSRLLGFGDEYKTFIALSDRLLTDLEFGDKYSLEISIEDKISN